MGKIFQSSWAAENTSLVIFKAGESLKVGFILGFLEEGLAEVTPGKTKGNTVLFLKPAVAVVQKFRAGKKQYAKHLRYARELQLRTLSREPKGDKAYYSQSEYYLAPVKIFPKLRVALKASGVAPIRIPGGFDQVVVYADEVAIADYSVTGSGGWIVKKSDIGGILKSLPPLQDSGEMGTFYIVWQREESCADLSLEAPPQSYEGDVTIVTFDKGSLLVKKIVRGNLEVEEAAADTESNEAARLDRRVPHNWRKKVCK